jgi:AraC-like DNA-binding protein
MTRSDRSVSLSDFALGTPNGRVNVSDQRELRIIAIGATRLNETWDFSNLRKPYFRVYCNDRPGAAIQMGRSWLPLEPFRLYLIPAWFKFATRSRRGVAHAYLHFDLPGWSATTVRAQIPRMFVAEGTDAFAKSFFESSLRVATGEPLTDALVFTFKTTSYALLAAATAKQANAPFVADRRVAALLDYVESNLSKPLRVSELARRAALAPDVLTRRFRREVGVTPARYVTERRVCRAAEQLFGSERSIDEIAELCGFPNRFHFTRVFTRYMGTPPAKYRSRGGQ